MTSINVQSDSKFVSVIVLLFQYFRRLYISVDRFADFVRLQTWKCERSSNWKKCLEMIESRLTNSSASSVRDRASTAKRSEPAAVHCFFYFFCGWIPLGRTMEGCLNNGAFRFFGCSYFLRFGDDLTFFVPGHFLHRPKSRQLGACRTRFCQWV